eukprot:6841871-Ditylum_brightwellii.AAC.2
MKRHIKTVDGISEELYGHTEKFGNWGEGQVRASSPPNWRTYKWSKSKWVGKAYVDDVDNVSIDQQM